MTSHSHYLINKLSKGIIKSFNNSTSCKPLISIITAVYNRKYTIEETINSVLNQNYEYIEYIVIDGGSTDGTLETIIKYDDYIDCLISEPDKGVYDALNKGIAHAHGEWIYFLGADDKIFDQNVLKNVFSTPQKGKFLYGNVDLGNTGRKYDGSFSKRKLIFNNICQQAIFYHRDLFKELGYFDLKYPLLSDWFFNMKAFSLKSTKPTYINQTIAIYSMNGMSSHNLDMEFFNEHAKLIRNIFGYWDFLFFKMHNIFKTICSYFIIDK